MKQILEDNLRGSPGAKHAWPSSGAYADISQAVRSIAVPTVVIVGDHDPQDPEEQQRRELLPLIGGSKLVILRDCGHLSPIEQPALLATAMSTFLESN